MTEHRYTPPADTARQNPDQVAGIDPVTYATQHGERFRQRYYTGVRDTVAAHRTMFGEASAHHLERLLEDMGEYHSEAIDGWQRALGAERNAHEGTRATVRQLRSELQETRTELSTVVTAHLATLHRLAERYKRAGRPVPEDIVDQIGDCEAPF